MYIILYCFNPINIITHLYLYLGTSTISNNLNPGTADFNYEWFTEYVKHD